ncbi:MAG: alpha/beta hydrolase [Mycobacteriales bacterium]
MPLDPYLAAMYAVPGDDEVLTAVQERAAHRTRTLAARPADYADDGLEVTDDYADQIPLRVYRPIGDQARPTAVYFHGGGWVLGDLDTHDWLARAIAIATDAVVVSVHYRLAPEHAFPAALDDAFAATCWADDHLGELGGASLAVAGDSAGGGLAAGVSLRWPPAGRAPLAAQLLLYPALDLTLGSPSLVENAVGNGLRSVDMQWFVDQYAPVALDRLDPYASPLLASDVGNSPPTVVVTAAYDPLRDEGDRYAARLRDAGVRVDHRCFPTLAHSFMKPELVAAVPDARTATTESLRLFADLLEA